MMANDWVQFADSLLVLVSFISGSVSCRTWIGTNGDPDIWHTQISLSICQTHMHCYSLPLFSRLLMSLSRMLSNDLTKPNKQNRTKSYWQLGPGTFCCLLISRILLIREGVVLSSNKLIDQRVLIWLAFTNLAIPDFLPACAPFICMFKLELLSLLPCLALRRQAILKKQNKQAQT